MASKAFKTKYDKHDRKYCCAGDAVIPVRKARKVEGVVKVFDTDTKFNMAEYINSFKDSCDINVLLKRFTAGDQDVIQRMSHQYGDFLDLAELPDNFNDMMAIVDDGKNTFDKLPIEIKNKFNNNYNEFFKDVGSDDWMEKMGYEQDKGTNEAVPVEDSGAAAAAQK